jgi:hypothetical protein
MSLLYWRHHAGCHIFFSVSTDTVVLRCNSAFKQHLMLFASVGAVKFFPQVQSVLCKPASRQSVYSEWFTGVTCRTERSVQGYLLGSCDPVYLICVRYGLCFPSVPFHVQAQPVLSRNSLTMLTILPAETQNNNIYMPLWSSGQSSWLQIQRPGFDSRHYQKNSSGSGTGSTQPREYNWGATWDKSSGSCLENREYFRKDPLRYHVATSIRKSWQSLRRQAAVARSV